MQYRAMSHAVRQKLISVLVITAFVLAFAVMVTLVTDGPLDVAVIIGVLIGFAIAAVEEFYVQGPAGQ